MKGVDGSTVGERGQLTIDEDILAGILGPPPRLPDAKRTWDELVEEAAAAENLAKERHPKGEAVDDDG